MNVPFLWMAWAAQAAPEKNGKSKPSYITAEISSFAHSSNFDFISSCIVLTYRWGLLLVGDNSTLSSKVEPKGVMLFGLKEGFLSHHNWMDTRNLGDLDRGAFYYRSLFWTWTANLLLTRPGPQNFNYNKSILLWILTWVFNSSYPGKDFSAVTLSPGSGFSWGFRHTVFIKAARSSDLVLPRNAIRFIPSN